MATLDDLIAEIDRIQVGLGPAAADATNHGAFIFKTHLMTGISRQLGSDMEFTEGSGVPVSVRYRLNGQGPEYSARIYPIGPVHWLRGTQAHDIAPRRKQGLKFDDGQIRGRAGKRTTAVRHPGSRRNRSTWDRDKDRAAREAGPVMAQYFRDLVVGGSNGAR